MPQIYDYTQIAQSFGRQVGVRGHVPLVLGEEGRG